MSLNRNTKTRLSGREIALLSQLITLAWLLDESNPDVGWKSLGLVAREEIDRLPFDVHPCDYEAAMAQAESKRKGRW